MLEGEKPPIRVLQALFWIGVGMVIHGAMHPPLLAELSAAIVLLALAVLLAARLEALLNSEVLPELALELTGEGRGESAGIASAVEFTRSVLSGRKSLYSDLAVSRLRVALLALLPFSTSMFISLTTAMLIDMSPIPRPSLTDGLALVFTSCTLILLFGEGPAVREPAHGEAGYEGSFTAMVEKYVYGGLPTLPPVLRYAIPRLAALFLSPKLKVKPPRLLLNIYLCSPAMVELVEKWKKEYGATVAGDIDNLFKCKNTGGLSKWVELHSDNSLKEILDKLLGKNEDALKKGRALVVKIPVREKGSNGESAKEREKKGSGERLAAYIAMTAWEGCIVYKRIRQGKRGRNRSLQWSNLEEMAEPWRMISVFMVGLQEYVDALSLEIELASRRAGLENIICYSEDNKGSDG
ncbi:hypothetical protein [Desulfurococcus mucosus]|uniref:hypothetical protein n=1 Tax=Desulfurococcus mucosus TaxID=2275 RepID=UPI000AF3871C|nr:hypothetical protein [Desulfurococcus mucosus]